MQPYLAMAGNNAWANATFYDAVTKLSREAFLAPRSGFFGSLAETLNHIYEVDLYYIDALVEGGAGRSVYDRALTDDAGALAQLQAAADRRLIAFCEGLTPEDLARRVTTERRGESVTERIADLLPHLFQHQLHHRGQAHVQLSQAGVAPPQLDDFFLDFGRVPSAAGFPR